MSKSLNVYTHIRGDGDRSHSDENDVSTVEDSACKRTGRKLGSYFYRAMHFSAKRGIAIACRLSVRLSVCDVGEL